MIDDKLKKDFQAYRIVHISTLSTLFIFLFLGLLPKYNKSFERIQYLFHLKNRFVNNYILNRAGELRYTKFQEVLKFIFKAGWGLIILKRDVKDAFQNVSVAL